MKFLSVLIASVFFAAGCGGYDDSAYVDLSETELTQNDTPSEAAAVLRDMDAKCYMCASMEVACSGGGKVSVSTGTNGGSCWVDLGVVFCQDGNNSASGFCEKLSGNPICRRSQGAGSCTVAQ